MVRLPSLCSPSLTVALTFAIAERRCSRHLEDIIRRLAARVAADSTLPTLPALRDDVALSWAPSTVKRIKQEKHRL